MMDDVDRPAGVGRLTRRGLLAGGAALGGAALAGAAFLLPRATSVDGCLARESAAALPGRIAFVDESGPPERPTRRLAVIDRDGAAVRYLTHGDDAVFAPHFSPSGRDIVYTSVSIAPQGSGVHTGVRLINSVTGDSEVVGDAYTTIYSPRFAPDDRTLVVTVARDDRANLFAIDLSAKMITRLTDAPAADSGACYSSDGRQICFASDRDGGRQIYLMDAGGGPARRISGGEADHMAPAWSPRGDLIAFTRIDRGDTVLGIMRTDGSRAVILARGSPGSTAVFAPNGEALMFSRVAQGGGSALFTVGLDGCGEARVATPGFALDPDWSARLG
jgi:TolB protein